MVSQTVLRGVVRGKTIELEELPGLPDGQEVAVTVHPTTGGSLLPARGESTRAETAQDIPGTPSNARLRELAAKNQPSQEWFVAEA
jgi:hypothetical protein